MKRILPLFLLFGSLAFGQFSPGYNWPGDINFTGKITAVNAKETAPFRAVTSDPVTCDSNNKEIILNTTSWNLKVCSSANTWTVITGTGGGGSSYVLPTATAIRLGGVMIGSGINVGVDGTISLGGGSYSLSTTGSLTVTKVAGTGGVTANTLVQITSTNTVVTSTIGTRGYGVALTSQASGQNVEVAITGTIQCKADNATNAGNIAIAGTSFAGYCRDSGTNNINIIPSNVNIIGIITNSVAQGQLVTIHLVSPLINGPNPLVMVGDSGSGGVSGAVPAPSSGDAAEGKFLAADGLWEVPSFISGMASQFGDCKVTRISGTQISIGPNNSTTNACIVNFGSTSYRITTPSSVTLSSSTTGVLYFWIDSTGSIDVGTPSDTTVSCTNCTSVTATSFPSDVITLGTATFTTGSFDSTGVTDYRAVYYHNNVSSGIGIITNESGTSTSIAVDTTVIPSFQTGSVIPNDTSCTATGQLYLQTGSSTNHMYMCSNNGTTFSWYQADGSGGSGTSLWSGLTDPTANLSLNMGSFSTTFNYNATTGLANMLTISDTTSNTGTGNMLYVNQGAGSTTIPLNISANGGNSQLSFIDKILTIKGPNPEFHMFGTESFGHEYFFKEDASKLVLYDTTANIRPVAINWSGAIPTIQLTSIGHFGFGTSNQFADFGSSDVWIDRNQTNVLDVSSLAGSIVSKFPSTVAGSTVASATTITPTGGIFHITGTSAISTINLPYTGYSGCLKVIADGVWTTTTSGNIADVISGANVGSLYDACYDGTKWTIQ